MPRDRVLFEFELHWHCHHKNVQSGSILKGKALTNTIDGRSVSSIGLELS